MPVLVTATVLYWAVDQKPGVPSTVVLRESFPIRMVVADGVTNTDVTPIIAKYILGKEQEKWRDLLQAAGNGLLQVSDIHRTPVITPSVPPAPIEQAAAQGGAQAAAKR